MMHIVALARIPVALAGGVAGMVITGNLYLRGVWWLVERRAAAIDAVEL